jgi:hypothetical protein
MIYDLLDFAFFFFAFAAYDSLRARVLRPHIFIPMTPTLDDAHRS